MWFSIPETKGIPLEEMARIFGDKIAVYEADIHIDYKANELIIEEHGVKDGDIQRVTTEPGIRGHPTVLSDLEKDSHDHVATVQHLDEVSKN